LCAIHNAGNDSTAIASLHASNFSASRKTRSCIANNITWTGNSFAGTLKRGTAMGIMFTVSLYTTLEMIPPLLPVCMQVISQLHANPERLQKKLTVNMIPMAVPRLSVPANELPVQVMLLAMQLQ
jgi:hypothetical protein